MGTKRGRPRGMSAKGEATREALYREALRLFSEEGYDQTSMRAIAKAAGVSPGLLYRYFDSKQAVVLALYQELSGDYARRVEAGPDGMWFDRFRFALETSLEVLGPHRQALIALVPSLVSAGEQGILSEQTAWSREIVEGAFVDAVARSEDVSDLEFAQTLGRVLYFAHLAVILFWLLDKSSGQRATGRLLEGLSNASSLISLGLVVPTVRRGVQEIEACLDLAFSN